MKKAKKLIIILSVLFLLILSCTDSTAPNENLRISGRVTNSFNEPVANAKIMLTYYTESITYRPETTFSFNLTNSTYVKLWISHHNITDTVKVIVDDYLTSGNQSFTWDVTNSEGLSIVSNYYDYHLRVNRYQIDDRLFFNRGYEDITGNEVNSYECFAITDDNGQYDFGIDSLPFSFDDNEFEVLDENGFVVDTVQVERDVKIWALHTDYNPVFIDSVYVNEDSKTVGNLSFD